MMIKCNECKKDCVCKGCNKNDSCRYTRTDNCKVTTSCGMRRSWTDNFMSRFIERN